MLPFDRLKILNTKENLWLYILTILKNKDLYGWEIPNLVEKNFGFKTGRITPYRVLYRLEKDAFVKSKTKERRRVYQITAKGKEEIDKARNFYKKVLNDLK